MDLSSLTIDASAAETSKMPDRKHVVQDIGPGELIQLSNTMVTIYVGPEKFFKDAFQGNFAEGSSKTMHLEEDDPEVFKLFVDFLYNSQATYNIPDENSTAFKELLVNYYALHTFADKIGLEDLEIYAQRKWCGCIYSEYPVRSKTPWRPLPEDVKFVYERCPKTSAFRQPLVRIAVDEYLAWKFEDFEYWGRLMASNVSFAEECGRKLKAHMKMKMSDESWPCKV
ncbi:hypothetical protein BKA61DRAFT_732092 [Leptodontidium sp. MPI-SDFR-AT-0119]|nr:hypothetical protein BKA61DRAFT_732092 [Leptodontidium sp. MPI-SDFR-AT-0119]